MTASVVAQSPSEKRRAAGASVPGWMSVAVVAAALLGGIYLLWWAVAGSAPRERTVTFSEVPRQAKRGESATPVGSMFRQLAKTATGVRVVRSDEWRVKGGDAVMTVAKKKSGAFDYTFYYDRSDLVPPEDMMWLVVRRDALNDEATALTYAITPEQLDVFRREQGATGMVIPAPDRKELAGLWEKYAVADAKGKPDAEQKLVAALDAAGQRNLEATKRSMSQRAKLVRDTLTPQQRDRVIQRNRQIRRW